MKFDRNSTTEKSDPFVYKTVGYCWSSSFHAIRLLLLRWILAIFGPSTQAGARHDFRHLGVDQQYPGVFWLRERGTPPGHAGPVPAKLYHGVIRKEQIDLTVSHEPPHAVGGRIYVIHEEAQLPLERGRTTCSSPLGQQTGRRDVCQNIPLHSFSIM